MIPLLIKQYTENENNIEIGPETLHSIRGIFQWILCTGKSKLSSISFVFLKFHNINMFTKIQDTFHYC